MFASGNVDMEPGNWKAFLMSRGCDELAFAEFAALASGGTWCYSEAMRHIHAICKRESGGHPLRSVSAYLIASCKDSWDRCKL